MWQGGYRAPCHQPVGQEPWGHLVTPGFGSGLVHTQSTGSTEKGTPNFVARWSQVQGALTGDYPPGLVAATPALGV